MVGGREMHADSLLGNLIETCRLKGVGAYGRIILKWEVVDRIHLDQDRNKWCAHVNTVKKLRAL
jgi:hypothetical protein